MKILVVDDDLNTVDAIINTIDWKTLNIDEALSAYSTSMAQRIVQEQQPEIILCDIEMPGENGIKFLKWIREKKILAEFIFLTCHDDFEFASEAIEYGAIGYVLKPFNKGKTISVILKAVAKVMNDKNTLSYHKYGEYIVNNKRQVIEKFWDDFLHMKNDADVRDIQKRAKTFDIDLLQDCKYRIVCICTTKMFDEVEPQILYLMRNVVTELILDDVEKMNSVATELEGRNYVAFALNEYIPYDIILSKVKSVIPTVNNYLKRTVNCFIGELYEMKHMYAANELVRKWCLDTPIVKGEVYTESLYTRQERAEYVPLEKDVYEEWLEEGNQIAIICGLRTKLNESYRENKNAFDSIFHDYIQIVYAVLAKKGIQVQILLEAEVYKKLLKYATYSALDFIKWASYVTEKTIQYIKESQDDTNVVKNAKVFIEGNYAEGITRNEVAEAVNLSPDYLARLFYRETGEHINDFINKYRIKKSKEMLKQSEISASEAGLKAGFSSATYFSTIFKKYTNMTPNEYKKMSKSRNS